MTDTIQHPNQSAAVNRRPAGQSDVSGSLSAIVTADRTFPAAVAEGSSLSLVVMLKDE